MTKEHNFSSYVEIKYERDYGKAKTTVFTGMTLCEGFYASRAAVVNAGIGLSKPIKLGSRISIPAKIEFILNPEIQNAYINAIFTFK